LLATKSVRVVFWGISSAIILFKRRRNPLLLAAEVRVIFVNFTNLKFGLLRFFMWFPTDTLLTSTRLYWTVFKLLCRKRVRVATLDLSRSHDVKDHVDSSYNVSNVLSDRSVHSGIGDDRSLLSTFIFMRW